MTNTDKKTILVVEDQALNKKLITDLLGLKGFGVLSAVDGREALHILENHIPDLIILDIQLPDINGFDILKKIREDKRFDSVKVLALTALAMREEKEKIERAGFDACILKPIDTKAFSREIEKFLQANTRSEA
jgi:CheY-like chemotaxis protein